MAALLSHRHNILLTQFSKRADRSYPVFVLGQMNLSSVECRTKLPFIFQFPVISGVAGCLLNQLSDSHCVPRSFVSEQMHSQLAGDEMCAHAAEGNQRGA